MLDSGTRGRAWCLTLGFFTLQTCSAVRYPSMPVPMPYAQIQVQPVAQLMEPAFDQIRMAQASLLTKPVLLSLALNLITIKMSMRLCLWTRRRCLLFTYCTQFAGVSAGIEGDSSSKPGALRSSHGGRLQAKRVFDRLSRSLWWFGCCTWPYFTRRQHLGRRFPGKIWPRPKGWQSDAYYASAHQIDGCP